MNAWNSQVLERGEYSVVSSCWGTAGRSNTGLHVPPHHHTHTHTTHTYTLSNVQYSEAFHIHFCGAQIVSNEQNF